ncbi:MAG: hypothetical protein HWE25_07900 [Alphaproteobacteria bacterium]|nr:hypothetical protein [Alphaproteobacteria bacterium]
MKKTVIIHAGFHRCASTATQDLIRQQRAAIETTGTTIMLREDLAGWLSGRQLRLLYRYRPEGLTSRLRLWLVKRMLRKTRANRVLISEELLLGLMPGVRERGFYPNFGNFLSAMHALSDEFDIQLRFIVRRPDRFLESAYAFRVPRGLLGDFQSYLGTIGPDAGRWLPLLRQVEQCGLGRQTRFGVLEDLLGRDAGPAIMDFIGMADAATDTARLPRGNRRPHSSEIQALVGEGTQTGFSESQRAGFLASLEQDNDVFLCHPCVDATSDIWRD